MTVALGNLWIVGYYYFVALYSFCNAFVEIKSMWHGYLLFALTGDWRVNELEGDEKCRALLETLM